MFIIAIIDVLSCLDDEAWKPYDHPEDGMPGDQEENASDKSDLEIDNDDDSDGANVDSGARQVQVQAPTDEPSDQGKFTFNPSISTFPPPMLPRPTLHCSSGGPGFLSLDSARASTCRDCEDNEWMPAAKRWRSSSRGASNSSAHAMNLPCGMWFSQLTAPHLMLPKHKNVHTSKTAAHSLTATADDTILPDAKWKRAAIDSGTAPSIEEEPNKTQLVRCSSCAGKGNGGQLQQLQNIEHIQTTTRPRPRIQNLDIATQGQPVNPMAPSHCSDDEASQIPVWGPQSMSQVQDDEESQIPLWVPQSTSQVQGQPSFMLSQHGQQFSFSIPSRAKSYNSSSLSSSHNSSASSVPMSSLMELKTILNGHPQDGHRNFTCSQQLQAKLQALLGIFLTLVLRLLSPLPSSSVSTQLVMKTPLLLLHNFQGYIECKPLLNSPHLYPNPTPYSPLIITVEKIKTDPHLLMKFPQVRMIVSQSQLCMVNTKILGTVTNLGRSILNLSQVNLKITILLGSQPLREKSKTLLLSIGSAVVACVFPIMRNFLLYMMNRPLKLPTVPAAVEYMNEAIAERRSQGLPIPKGWWPQYMPEISKLLWEDLGNWQSALKKKAHAFIHEHYEWDSQNHHPVNAEIARKLLECGNFLKDGVDEVDHMNNLAHPALSSLVIDFFYTGTNAMANIFLEVFENEVPHAAIAFAATAI
ncbi:hypothetical protein SCLCIDRAFT_24937 [Scleroderma citrinum Foug A]|uniref:DUF6532 domain-containing protein n=1 Tax=Scleroderma citrinum Foug A TaxID=1036808 RepID=A0A0C3E2E2_9AGAM|nr:hypothetical protein SCLCIDRAFT_24937 [Scleroderma citrinum Foug A]